MGARFCFARSKDLTKVLLSVHKVTLALLRANRLEEHSRNVRIHFSKRESVGISCPSLENSTFDCLLLESIDEALADLLGRRSRDLIYDHLATYYRCGREELPGKIYEFHEFLENTFASSGKTVGRTIVRRLCDKLGYEFVHVPGFEFYDYLDALRARYERSTNMRDLATQAESLKL
jgi:hypothetical protein